MINACEQPNLDTGTKWSEHSAVFKKSNTRLSKAMKLAKDEQIQSNLEKNDESDTHTDEIDDNLQSPASWLSEDASNANCSTILKEIMKSLAELNYRQKEIQHQMHEMKTVLDKILLSDTLNKVDIDIVENKISLPLKSSEELDNLEKKLIEEQNYMKLFASDLSLAGEDSFIENLHFKYDERNY